MDRGTGSVRLLASASLASASRACLSAIVVALACAPGALAGDAGAAAGSATISGELTGLPSQRGDPRREVVVVRAVRAETGVVAASARPARSRRYTLRVPAGDYVVLADVSDLRAHRAYAARSHVVRLKRGRKRVNLQLRRSSASRAASRYGDWARPASALRTIGVSPSLRITGLPGYDGPKGLRIDDWAIAESLQPCPAASGAPIQVVELRRRSELLKEIKLSNSRFGDPSTRITPHFLSNDYLVTGGGQARGGSLSAGLQLVHLPTGRVVAKAQAAGKTTSALSVMEQLFARFHDELCKDESEAALFDVIVDGTGTYSQSQGPEPGNGAHQTVTAPFTWRLEYRGIGIYKRSRPGETLRYIDGPSPTFSGSYTQRGQTQLGGNTEALEDFTCSGQDVTTTVSADPGYVSVELTGTASGQQSISVTSLVRVGYDPTPPYNCNPATMFPGWSSGQGFEQAIRAVSMVSDSALAQNEVVLNASPAQELPADCGPATSIFNPCTQTLSWTGTVTLRKTCEMADIQAHIPGVPSPDFASCRQRR